MTSDISSNEKEGTEPVDFNDINKIEVISRSNKKSPFSVGYLANILLAIGLTYDQAYEDSLGIAGQLLKLNISSITTNELMTLTQLWYDERSKKQAQRIRILREKLEPISPLVILIGGVTGIGKSTLAEHLSNRLGIRLLIGTDSIREVMRSVFSETLMPSLHTSSYAGAPTIIDPPLPNTTKNILAFEEQSRLVMTGIEAAILRCIQDNQVLIIEGVHILPGILSKKVLNFPNIIQIALTLNDEDEHMARLRKREANLKRGTKYSELFENIREIQKYLVNQCKEHNIPIIDVQDDERALQQVINTIWDDSEEIY